ncbi:hypothetical protein Zm00014a_025116, partial [Zea mays]
SFFLEQRGRVVCHFITT